jgi:hypothetical protein
LRSRILSGSSNLLDIEKYTSESWERLYLPGVGRSPTGPAAIQGKQPPDNQCPKHAATLQSTSSVAPPFGPLLGRSSTEILTTRGVGEVLIVAKAAVSDGCLTWGRAGGGSTGSGMTGDDDSGDRYVGAHWVICEIGVVAPFSTGATGGMAEASCGGGAHVEPQDRVKVSTGATKWPNAAAGASKPPAGGAPAPKPSLQRGCRLPGTAPAARYLVAESKVTDISSRSITQRGPAHSQHSAREHSGRHSSESSWTRMLVLSAGICALPLQLREQGRESAGEAPGGRVRSFRNGGQHHCGMMGGIISERGRRRHHSGILGGSCIPGRLARNQNDSAQIRLARRQRWGRDRSLAGRLTLARFVSMLTECTIPPGAVVVCGQPG